MKKGIVIAAILIFPSLFASLALAQTSEKETYLQKNYTPLNNNGSNDSLPSQLVDIGKYKVYFIGEYHHLDGNEDIRLQFIKHLYYKEGIKNIVYEGQISGEELFNDYIVYGDTSKLRLLSLIYPKEHVQSLITLYEFNKVLPIKNRIRLNLIDVESNWNITVRELKKLIPTIIVPKSIRKTVVKLMSFYLPDDISHAGHFKISYKKLARNIFKSVRENESIYKEFLGVNFDLFKKITEGFFTGIKYYSRHVSKMTSERRETILYNNYKELLEAISKMF